MPRFALLLALGTLPLLAQPLQQTKPERIIPLEGDTYHVQGVLVEESRVLVTAVDTTSKKGWLMEFDLATGKRLRTVEIQQGEMFHPGGFDADDGNLYIPVAEYRANSRAVIQKRSKRDLSLVASFEVPDHIGAVAVAKDRLYLANWDARKIYDYSLDGKLLRTRQNPTGWRYQDMKFRYGSIAAAAVAPRPATDHSIVWIDPETLQPLNTVHAGFTDRKVPFTNEGLDARDGTIYLLPEDSPSRLFVFKGLGD